jgi:hypothetical protein
MALYVDVRVCRDQAGTAVQAIINKSWQSLARLQLDLDPPASGPEVELSLELNERHPIMVPSPNAAEDVTREILDNHGVSVLAIRSRTWLR